MTKAVLFSMVAVGVAACSGGAKDATTLEARRSDGARAEQSLAAGTLVKASIQSAVSSRTDKPGELLRAVVNNDVKGAHGGVVIPAGSDVTLRIAQIEPGSDDARPEGRLALVVRSVAVYGHSYSLDANLATVPHHLEGRDTAAVGTAATLHRTYRDVVVSAGTPIAFTLTSSLNVSPE